MKKILVFAAVFIAGSPFCDAQFKNLGNRIKSKVNQRIDQKTDQTIDKGLDHIQDSIENAGKGSGKSGSSNSTVSNTSSQDNNVQTPAVAASQPPSFKAYSNYDFIPGDNVLFEDNFSADDNGEFASHWELGTGQAVVNKMGDKTVLMITDGGWVSPLMKKKSYLSNEWTIEFDNIKKEETYSIHLYLQDAGKNDLGKITVGADGVSADFKDAEGNDKNLYAANPEEIRGDNFNEKWHHVAVAFKNGQVKVYVDQFRVLVVPNLNLKPEAVALGAIASPQAPLVFTNVRIAEGGKMNMLTKKFTDTKIVTHGINFDVNKAIIKPESMGTLNAVAQIMKDNPDIKFEVGGHTDNDGDDALNLKLSQSRADAVKAALINLGIDASRLTSKGYGKTKPIADNASFEGKANNRRVEFVKK